jgi:alkanesulfonate monooxygenase SsuD/methylene tetrahydromethanopterin reductase-like flavin-dependent oxidoreductase (luciferase family)
MVDAVAPPFAQGSISLCLAPVGDGGRAVMRRLLADAQHADDVGFDGVTLSEHHAGFARYVPTPLVIAAQLLSRLPRAWAAACPAILPMRPPVVVAEDLAWLEAAYPGRVGAGFVAGYQRQDFEVVGADFDGRNTTFWDGLSDLVGALGAGSEASPLKGDPAVDELGDAGLPLLAGIGGPVGARRAARLGVGLLLTSLRSATETAVLVQAYRDAGGRGPVVLKRRVHVGADAGGFGASESAWHSRAESPTWLRADDTALLTGSAAKVSEGLLLALRDSGVDALNLHLDAYTGAPESVTDQIDQLGAGVLPAVRASLSAAKEPR